MTRRACLALAAALAAGGCAMPRPPAQAPDSGLQRYRCEQDVAFTVRFMQDAAQLDAGARGREVLGRDAGGLTPQQSVFSNAQLRAEFGLGADGQEAVLRYLQPPLALRCRRQ